MEDVELVEDIEDDINILGNGSVDDLVLDTTRSAGALWELDVHFLSKGTSVDRCRKTCSEKDGLSGQETDSTSKGGKEEEEEEEEAVVLVFRCKLSVGYFQDDVRDEAF